MAIEKCFEVLRPDARVFSSLVEGLNFCTTRRVAFNRYRDDFACNGELQIHYEGAEDLIEPARLCAEQIVAGACTVYAVAEKVRGNQNFGLTVARKEIIEAHTSRYVSVLV